jgi:hypothetical protein
LKLSQTVNRDGASSDPNPRQIHDEIWPILERYTERVEDPSLRPPDARANRVFFFTGVSPRR